MRRRNQAVVFVPVASLLVLAVLSAGGCGSDPPVDANADGGGPGGGGSTDGGGGGGSVDGNTYVPGDGAPGSCTPLVLPDGTTPACADCKDNDGDGFADWLDPECAGPLDNDEATFGTGIPGDNQDACKQDCFFDGNSGQGDDKCEWNLKCDPAITSGACTYDPGFGNCPGTQTQNCVNFCQKLAPNGCDCFGCCAVNLPGGGTKDVRLTSTCSLADINDPVKCPPCTQVPSCANDCGTCELCIGKTTLPPECAQPANDAGTPPPAGGQTCSTGAQVCNAEIACPSGTYCVTGCCIPIVN